MAIFQFFGMWTAKKEVKRSCVLYKKKLIYANLFFTIIGDKNVVTLQNERRNSKNA